MSPKILSQTGISLSDVYDVQGSIVGIDQITTREVGLMHEMGGTIFSERMGGDIVRQSTGAILQNATWDLDNFGQPVGIYRVLGVYVQVDVTARISFCQVSIRSVNIGREIPIFIWDTTNDVESDIRIVENAQAVGNVRALIQVNPVAMPSLGIGVDQNTLARVGDEIVFRGVATGFGAGNVTCTALVYVAFARQEGISSIGLPIPGW